MWEGGWGEGEAENDSLPFSFTLKRLFVQPGAWVPADLLTKACTSSGNRMLLLEKRRIWVTSRGPVPMGVEPDGAQPCPCFLRGHRVPNLHHAWPQLRQLPCTCLFSESPHVVRFALPLPPWPVRNNLMSTYIVFNISFIHTQASCLVWLGWHLRTFFVVETVLNAFHALAPSTSIAVFRGRVCY